MAEYQFTTVWRIRAPHAAVWEAILHADRWPRWWQGLEQFTEVEKGNGRGIGALHRYTWKGALPYRLTFEMRVLDIEPMQLLKGEARGEVVGEGLWRFSCDGADTIVRYHWHIHTCVWWMNLLAPLIRPLFQWNHDVVMRDGARGLAQLLSARVDTGSEVFAPSGR